MNSRFLNLKIALYNYWWKRPYNMGRGLKACEPSCLPTLFNHESIPHQQVKYRSNFMEIALLAKNIFCKLGNGCIIKNSFFEKLPPGVAASYILDTNNFLQIFLMT